ncbi:helix-turn-helix domain-containing protein [Amycolatopsis taiwanensis]|uniref:Uncharacterized protein n=1 Tax=Amycolatopsis taiwanensis TaxID=342230 RepID=A0A9W6VG03_9PSEU|nr:helix-turn-helix transcriptional regulator [Amycolatopsis taiwanensis]GLY66022.1 hypothetical protein Atai01_26410 [Amycolatopsis taiwanensis]
MSSSEHATNGAFAEALRASIARSGLTLDRVQARLHARGISVSVTALSYWQSGKRQPERSRSISAVRGLEEVLGLRAGELFDLLSPPRPRGASRPRRALGDTVNFPPDPLRALLKRVGAPHALEQRHRLDLVSLHDRGEIAGDGGQRSLTTRIVFRATGHGQDRWLLIYDHGGTDAEPPRLQALRNCTTGRFEVDAEHGLTAAELLFHRKIDRGETQLIEYALVNSGPPYPECQNTYYREFRRPVHEYLLEIQFDTSPSRCWQYTRVGDAPEQRQDLLLDTGGGVHAVAADFGPGVFGIAWH